MDIKKISFPVYKLEDHPPSKEGDVLFYAKQDKKGTKVKVIDDTSIEGDTFGKRRTRLMLLAASGEVQLQKINTAVFFLGDFLRIAKPNTYFIDSTGKVFKYTKARTVPLVCRRITKVIKQVGTTLLEIDGIPSRFQSLFPPNDTHKFASLLKLSAHNYLLYGFNEEMHRDTVRKI